jgi:cell division protein FtsA
LARRERYLVGLDVGTSRVTAVVGESMDDGTLDIVGIGVAESRGIKRGVVVNVDAAVDSIKKAIEGSGADGGGRDRLGASRAVRARTSRDSTAAA